jgi:hypothetical protein
MIPLLFLALAATSAPAGADSPTPQMEKLLQDCDAHKFETVVNTTVDGKAHQSKVKLCGTRGQTDAAWVDTLKDAVAKVKANDKMPPELRDQIATALDAEILRLAHSDTMALIANSAPAIAKPAPPSGIASLAPRPTPGAAAVSSRPLADDYGSLPPLPAPKPALAAGAAVGSFLPSLPAPRMTLQCGSTDDPLAVDRCSMLESNTVLFIRADEPMPAGTSLRFVRRDDPRGDVQLAQLRTGQTVRIPLPHRVCDGVVRSEVAIEVVRKPAKNGAPEQVVDRLGPYGLHC